MRGERPRAARGPGSPAASELREQFRSRRGHHAGVVVHSGRRVTGLVHNCMETAVVLVEDPASMTGVHFVLLDEIEGVDWGRVAATGMSSRAKGGSEGVEAAASGGVPE